MKIDRLFVLEWASTIILIVGVILTSYNIYPANVWFSMVGNCGWLLLGWVWRKWSLLTVQVIITIIYIAGIVNVYL